MSEETQTTTADTEEAILTPEEQFAKDYEATRHGWPDPQMEEQGESEQPEAVDPSKGEDNPQEEETENQKPEPETGERDEGTADEPSGETEQEQTVNFDGLPDRLRSNYERGLKAGIFTPEDVEEARNGYLRQDRFSKGTEAARRAEEKSNALIEANQEILDQFKKIRDSDHYHAAWLKLTSMSEEEARALVDGEEDDEFITPKRAREIADERFKQRQQEADARTKKQQQAYEDRKLEIGRLLGDVATEIGVDAETITDYANAIEAQLPTSSDPILHYKDLRDLKLDLLNHHKDVLKDAEIADLKAQLSKKTTREDQNAKQSLKPSPRTKEVRRPATGAAGILSQVEEEMGLDPDWFTREGAAGGAGWTQES